MFQYENQRNDRSKVPPHIKTFARVSDKEAAWFCLTSANLSTAAWGQLQVKETQLMIRNYEVGVLFLPSKMNKMMMVDSHQKTTQEIVHFPLPYIYPPPSYVQSQDKIWTWAYLKFKGEK